MNIIENIKQTFRQGNAVTRLLLINVAVFVVYNAIQIIFTLFKTSYDLSPFLAIPAGLNNLLTHPWTILTYMFMHQNIWHILFNMIALYWFGKIFTMAYSDRQLIGLYITGGFSAALLYILSYNIFPFFSDVAGYSILMGASGSIMAIIVAAAVKFPNLELRMLLLGNIKLKYIAIVYTLISFFGITSNNAGGEIAHLGGALYGYLFVVSLQRGKDLTKFVNKIIDFFVNLFSGKLFRPKPLKATKSRKMNDGDYNAYKANKMADIDKILDKIKKSGYESLTTEEKKKLFDQGNK